MSSSDEEPAAAGAQAAGGHTFVERRRLTEAVGTVRFVGARPSQDRANGRLATGVLSAIDQAGDAWSDRLRGKRWADLGAAVLSNLSDHGVVWVVLAGVKARRPGAARRRAIWTLACAGVASFSVNRAVKQLVGRSRPAATGAAAGSPGALPVRHPSSSSFPSGHTLAAFCTAIALGDGPAETAAMLGFAAAVAASRVHLRAHHLSDVLGGAGIGSATGVAVRALLDRQLGCGAARVGRGEW